VPGLGLGRQREELPGHRTHLGAQFGWHTVPGDQQEAGGAQGMVDLLGHRGPAGRVAGEPGGQIDDRHVVRQGRSSRVGTPISSLHNSGCAAMNSVINATHSGSSSRVILVPCPASQSWPPWKVRAAPIGTPPSASPERASATATASSSAGSYNVVPDMWPPCGTVRIIATFRLLRSRYDRFPPGGAPPHLAGHSPYMSGSPIINRCPS